MKASHFITLVQNTHSKASVQPALAGVVPGIVSAAPVQSITDPTPPHGTQSKIKQVRKKERLT